MVVQKGRLFQQEHPKVPVLLDKGRYLVVDLDPRKAKKWDQGQRPCFAIRPLPATSVAFDAPAPRARHRAELPWVRTLVNRITRAPFEMDLKRLVAFPTRFSTSSHYAAAAKLARTQLKQLGFQTRLQTITVNSGSSFNVIADKAGQGPTPRGVVIVGAHLDSINISGGPTAPAPGADDDGSGSAGVLSIARVFQDHAAIHDLRLILFGGEEEGLFGSQRYVASLSPALRKRIRAVVHMDMIATLNTTQPTVLLEGAALSQSVIDGLADAAATHSQLKVQTSLNPFNSDHVSFLDANMPAVLTIEGTDDANQHIHSANDTLAHINFELALEVLRMNVAFVAQAIGKMP
jgi:Zn-dependent M28 family amino/carboxypeptidase